MGGGGSALSDDADSLLEEHGQHNEKCSLGKVLLGCWSLLVVIWVLVQAISGLVPRAIVALGMELTDIQVLTKFF